MAVRGQKTNVWHFFSKRLFKIAKTGKKVETDKANDVVCEKKGNELVASKCTLATDTANNAATMKSLFAYITAYPALNGNKVNGQFACPVDIDRCPGAKVRAIAKGAGTTATSIVMQITDKYSSCNYLIEASCDVPYVYMDTTSADYAAAAHTGLAYSVVEYDGNFVAGNKKLWSTEIASNPFKFGQTVPDFDNVADADIKKLPSAIDANTFAANTNNGKDQRLIGRTAKQYVVNTVGYDVDASTLHFFWKAKMDEYTKFNTDKTAYETKRDAYNKALEAAEKLTKDTLDKDMFRKLSPTAEDKKVLNAVPARPMNPTLPAKYSGPTPGADATKTDKGLFWMASPDLSTDVTGANHLYLGPGKSFGSQGLGLDANTAPVKATDDGKGINLSLIQSQYKTGTTCQTYYMMFQAGHAASNTAALSAKKQTIKYGSKAAANSFDGAVTYPTAATDPKTPSTGASMLAAGAASLAVAMTLF